MAMHVAWGVVVQVCQERVHSLCHGIGCTRVCGGLDVDVLAGLTKVDGAQEDVDHFPVGAVCVEVGGGETGGEDVGLGEGGVDGGAEAGKVEFERR